MEKKLHFILTALLFFLLFGCNLPNGEECFLDGTTVTVDSEGNVGRYTSIAVEGSNVYISYYYIDNSDLKFARSNDD
jgi:hypothetical protein